MLDEIKDNDLIICPFNIKYKLLEQLSFNKVIKNIKFMSIEEFCGKYFGTYDEKSLYFLMENFGLKYGVAKSYLDNIYFDVDFLKKYYDFLDEKKLLIRDDIFKNKLSNICVIGYDNIDVYIKNELSKYNVRYVKQSCTKKNLPVVYGFDRQTDEILYVASLIRKKIHEINFNDIFLVNLNESYREEVRRIFSFYNIPINLDEENGIYGTNTVNVFLDALKEKRNIVDALGVTPKNIVYNKIVDILNKYTFVKTVDDVFVEIIIEEIKRASVNVDKIENAVNLCTIDDITSDNYYFILGFNQGAIPRIYHDDDLFNDDLKLCLGMNTSLDKFQNEKQKIKNILNNENVCVSYKLRDYYNTFYPSSMIEEFNFKVLMNPKIDFIYSNLYNELKLADLLDKYIKYNEKAEVLPNLYSTYKDIPYLNYNNAFDGVEKNDICKFLNGHTNLSYSSMNNYFLCAFRFYIQNILKLNPFESNFASFIGTLFHECLSKMYDDDFDLKKIYNGYIDNCDLSFKEKHFIGKLYADLEFVIETIRKQEEHSSFDKVFTEKKFCVDKSKDIKINFLGFIDKIKYKEEDNKVLVAIIDYKTGVLETNLDNINYGLHLQLPVYVYLTKKGLHKNVEIVGFYLQKILNNTSLDSLDASKELERSLRLDGYSIDDTSLIEKFDDSYASSYVIKGMGVNSKGFSHYAKICSADSIDKMENIVEKKIDEVAYAISNACFDINPKRIDGKLVGCDFCEFKDLCFKKEEDVVDLKNTKFCDIVGGEVDA